MKAGCQSLQLFMNILFILLSLCKKSNKVEVPESDQGRFLIDFLELQHKHFHFCKVSEQEFISVSQNLSK